MIDDGHVLSGAAPVLNRLSDKVIRLGADPNADLPDPARYPNSSVRPSKHWVSRVGGRWTYVWMDN